MGLLAPVEFDHFVIPHQPCMYCDFCFWLFQRYVPGTRMFQVVSDRAPFSPCPCRLLLSVRVLILKEYGNLHVHLEDFGRRVTNASGAFLELAPSSRSSINCDACSICIYLAYRYVFFSCTHTIARNILCMRKPATGSFQAAGEDPCR